MSLDVYLEGPEAEEPCHCTDCGHAHTRMRSETYFDANITHNLNDMAETAGLYHPLWRPEDIMVTVAEQLIIPLTEGLALLRADPKKYKAMNPKSGFGRYEDLVSFVSRYLDACKQYPHATVKVSR